MLNQPYTAPRLNPDHPIAGLAGLTIGDFWSWAYSDVLVNTVRPLLAEFFVAATLGQLDQLRLEWDAVDVRYKGAGIEVKGVWRTAGAGGCGARGLLAGAQAAASA